MRLKRVFAIGALLLSLSVAVSSPSDAQTRRHSAAWYRTHRAPAAHSAAWYRTHRAPAAHSAAWYRRHRK